ncbi:MAG: potassium transporter TrkG [Candidatus Competibacterales bacterium]|nr:potassium transporter TrkG [Candidatus Competibacterales bacterium]
MIAIGAGLLWLLVPAETPMLSVLFEITSALGSVGLPVGITGSELHWAGKRLLMLLMWMGRLEILPVIALRTWAARHVPARTPR